MEITQIYIVVAMLVVLVVVGFMFLQLKKRLEKSQEDIVELQSNIEKISLEIIDEIKRSKEESQQVVAKLHQEILDRNDQMYKSIQAFNNKVHLEIDSMKTLQRSLIEQFHTTEGSLKESMKENQKLNFQELQSLEKQFSTTIAQSIDEVKDLYTNSFTITEERAAHLSKKQQELKQEMVSLHEQNNANVQKISQLLSENLSVSLHNIASLKIANFINTTNEISKYKNGVEEEGGFIKEFAHCKLVQIRDKKDKAITQVEYEENGKYRSKVFVKDKLKYIMEYKENQLVKSYEYDDKQNLLFEYHYDVAGEITKRVEYLTNGKKKTTKY